MPAFAVEQRHLEAFMSAQPQRAGCRPKSYITQFLMIPRPHDTYTLAKKEKKKKTGAKSLTARAKTNKQTSLTKANKYIKLNFGRVHNDALAQIHPIPKSFRLTHVNKCLHTCTLVHTITPSLCSGPRNPVRFPANSKVRSRLEHFSPPATSVCLHHRTAPFSSTFHKRLPT